MNALLALQPAAWSFGDIVIGVIIFAAVVAILYIALRQFGLAIPNWVTQIFWVVVVCIVAILAVRFILSL